MAPSRHAWSGIVSLGVHGLVLAAMLLTEEPTAGDAPTPPRIAPTVVEVIEVSEPVQDPLEVPEAPVRVQGRSQAPPKTQSPQRRKTRAHRSPRLPRSTKHTPEESTEAPAVAASIAVPIAPSPNVEVPDAAEMPSIPPRSGVAAGGGSGAARLSGGNGGRGSLGGGGAPDEGRAGVRGREEDNYAAYGAAIVRLVVAELDRSEIPGIGARDSVHLVLEVRPDGSLARLGPRRFDIASVVKTTLGWLPMRQILRRIATASRRFPDHPAGFSKDRFVVDLTVNFADPARRTDRTAKN